MAVRAGSFCAPPGAADQTSRGTSMVCAERDGKRARWGAAGGSARADRRRLLAEAKKAGVVVKRGTPDDRVRQMIADAGPAAAEPAAGPASAAPLAAPVTPDPVAATEPTAPVITTGPAVDRRPNGWGGVPTGAPGEVHYHPDGELGQAANAVGAEGRTLYVDGEPLAVRLDRLATETTLGRLHPQDQVDQLRRLADALPEGRAKRVVRQAVDDLDAPAVSADLPEGAHPVIRDLAEELVRIPLIRGAGRDQRGMPELDALRAMRPNAPAWKLVRDLRERVGNRRHESKEGKVYIDAFVRQALRKLGE